MASILFPAAVAVIVFIAILLLLQQRISSDEDRRKKAMIDQISETSRGSLQVVDENLLKDRTSGLPSTGLSGLFFKLPGIASTYDLILKAGFAQKRVVFLFWTYIAFVILAFLLRKMGIYGVLIAGTVSFIGARRYLRRRIQKRNEQFLNLFPDAVDMIVRSVKSGHPLNTALRMIADNMEDPVREEFKQVVDEVSYGRTLPEALIRLSHRIDEQDLHFFVVVLSVQQETGGSLAEVLTNLSTIIRKRRQLRLKIRALTSEGRATSYVLGSLPVLEFLALYYVTPGYLEPLFVTLAGNIVLGLAVTLIITAMWIVRGMVNIEI